MYQIMVNVAIDYLKSNAHLVYYDDNALDVFYSDSVGELDFDNMGIDVEEAVQILQSLPKQYRTAFNMREVEGMEYNEIAALLMLPESTVRSHVARARQLISKKLKSKGI